MTLAVGETTRHSGWLGQGQRGPVGGERERRSEWQRRRRQRGLAAWPRYSFVGLSEVDRGWRGWSIPDGGLSSAPACCPAPRRAYKYVPYGKVGQVMPYLLRRAAENSDILKVRMHGAVMPQCHKAATRHSALGYRYRFGAAPRLDIPDRGLQRGTMSCTRACPGGHAPTRCFPLCKAQVGHPLGQGALSPQMQSVHPCPADAPTPTPVVPCPPWCRPPLSSAVTPLGLQA